MLVIVRDGIHIKTFDVPNQDRDQARKIAFRFHYKKIEEDFNELVHSTSMLDVETIGDDLASYLLKM